MPPMPINVAKPARSIIESAREMAGSLGAAERTGNLGTFDNDFCSQRGLEPYGVKVKKNPDLSYIIPLLLG
jgi:hypothetical protein